MAERLRQQSSKLPYGGSHQGCMPGLLHFLDFNQRLHIRKMLAYKRHGDGKHPWRIKFPKMKQGGSSACKEHELMDRDGNIMTGDDINVTNKSSGTTPIRTLNSKRSREQNQKKNISPLASRLLRTISMHRLECNDYVDEMVLDTENSIIGHSSQESCFSASSEHIPLLPNASGGPTFQNQCEVCGTLNSIHYVDQTQLDELGSHFLKNQSLLREKLNEAKEVLSNNRVTDANELGGDVAFHQSKELLDVMQLINRNRELLLKILEDPSFIANYLQSQQTSSAEIVLTKQGAGFSGRKNDGPSGLEHKLDSVSVINQGGSFQAGTSCSTAEEGARSLQSVCCNEVCILKPEYATRDSAIYSNFDILSSPCELKAQRENQKKDQSAANRFKAIKQRIKDVLNYDRKEGHRISMDGILHKIPYGAVPKDSKKEKQGLWESPASDKHSRDKYAHKSIKRSHSLNESLDKYSRLLESISSRELKRLPDGSKLMQQYGGGFQGTESPKALGRIFSLPEFGSYSLRKGESLNAASSVEIPTMSPKVDSPAVEPYCSEELKSVGSLEQKEEGIEEDTTAGRTIFTSGTIYEAKEQLGLINDQEKCKPCDILEDIATEDSSDIPFLKQEIGSNEPTKPSPFLVSSATSSDSEGSELEPRHIHCVELDSLTDSLSQFDVDATDRLEGNEPDYDSIKASSNPDDLNFFLVQVDQKDDANYNYVRDILRKSGIGGDVLLGAWYSPYQPVDPLLFEEAECSTHELDVPGDEPDPSLEHQLLFDLINEILLEIYEPSFTCYPGLSRFDGRIRPMPMGHHILEEVWANITWHLSSQSQLDPSLDYVVARDFAKNDGWMDLQYDFEDAGLELEDMILDDLLDEVVLQLGDLPGSQCVLP